MGGGRGTEVVLKSSHHHRLELFALITMVLLIGVFFFCDLGSTWGYADTFC